MIALRIGVALLWLVLAAGCASTSSPRGEVEFGRVAMFTKVEVPPQLAEAPEVRYPEVLLAQGVEGTAEMTFTVDEVGSTTDIKIRAASHPEFGEAAEAGIRRLRFVPARRGVARVRCVLQQTFFFRIN